MYSRRFANILRQTCLRVCTWKLTALQSVHVDRILCVYVAGNGELAGRLQRNMDCSIEFVSSRSGSIRPSRATRAVLFAIVPPVYGGHVRTDKVKERVPIWVAVEDFCSSV